MEFNTFSSAMSTLSHRADSLHQYQQLGTSSTNCRYMLQYCRQNGEEVPSGGLVDNAGVEKLALGIARAHQLYNRPK